MSIDITTNNQPRLLVPYDDMPPNARRDHDYIRDSERFDNRFFQYKGVWYDAYEFQRCSHIEELSDWDGYQPDSFFSGTLIKYLHENEEVIAGWYCS